MTGAPVTAATTVTIWRECGVRSDLTAITVHYCVCEILYSHCGETSGIAIR